MKIVFLDIDGVLNIAKSIEAYERQLELQISHQCAEDLVRVLDDDAVNNLMTLLAKTGAKIVLSSNWRIMRSVDQLQQLFAPRGFGKLIIDKTEDSHGGSRGQEIQSWLEAQDTIESFVILDDMDDGILDLFPHHFVECIDIEKGFADQNMLNQAIKILGEKL